MAKNMVFLVHKTNNSVIYTNSKSDLAAILGVSLRTIIRNYSNVGMYESMHYIIYVGVKKYDNGVVPKYRTNVAPPKPKLYTSTKWHTNTNNMDNMTHSNHNIGHYISLSKPSIIDDIDEESIEVDWRIVEKNLPIGEYDKFYSTRTLEQLESSKKYFLRDTIRLKYINKYGELAINNNY